ncbi:hypothetical protein HYPSUDRAFT_341784 [Hypholoma sublateritium FD-334 SS-4]|uniref:Secreted protein n=1 Tax=Hypholoma sublateritium (strain FD-334 SS-4) TaxID=945553 RepID=A0A0D2P4X8_HYPSF|nr:hypothetical protein HYPSUDRAFT_341784 [Hypholoma sublateritium FD-334 SS-4]
MPCRHCFVVVYLLLLLIPRRVSSPSFSIPACHVLYLQVVRTPTIWPIASLYYSRPVQNPQSGIAVSTGISNEVDVFHHGLVLREMAPQKANKRPSCRPSQCSNCFVYKLFCLRRVDLHLCHYMQVLPPVGSQGVL